MCDNCKCKTAIETEWISTDYGQQLRFAVPESGMNEPSVDDYAEIRMEALKFEVLDYLDSQIATMEDWKEDKGSTSLALVRLSMVRRSIKNIFDKY